jgi:putative hydrolase of HD superfamily
MSLVRFTKIVENLKRVKRTGWIVAGVKSPESVAEHSYCLAVLCMVLGKKNNLNVEKLMKMALIHDLAESIVGDLVEERGYKIVMNPKKKLKLEKEALKRICDGIGGDQEYLLLWEEFEENRSPEARLVKQLDKFEMVAQALEYDGEVESKKLDEFWENAYKHLKEPELVLLLEELSKLRKKKSG